MHKLVEVVGLPGAGKSTLCIEFAKNRNCLTETDLSRNWQNQSNLGKAHVFFLSLFELILWWRVFKLILGSGLWRNKDSIIRLVKLPAQRVWLKKNLIESPVLMDQGMLQILWSALISSGKDNIDHAYLNDLFRAYYKSINVKIVSLQLPFNVAAERIINRKERKTSRFDVLSFDEVNRQLSRYAGLFEQIIKAVQQAQLTVISVDALQDVDTLCNQLKTEIDDKLDIAYIFMRFPTRREAFAHAELNALASRGHSLQAFSLLGEVPGADELIKSRGPQMELVQSASVKRISNGLLQMLIHPILLIKTLVWIIANSQLKPIHYIKAVTLLPRQFDILKQLREETPDVIHLFWGHYPATLFFLAEASGLSSKKTMFLGAYDLKTQWHGSVAASVMSEQVFTHAHTNVTELKQFGIPSEKITVVHRGINLNLSKPPEEKPSFSLIAAGAMVPTKRQDIAVLVLAELISRGYDAYLNLCGEGPELSQLTALVDKLKLNSRVVFKGHVSQAELFALFARHRYFIFLTEYPTERLPNVVKEAMVHGCVVMTTKSEGIEELIDNEVNGFIFDNGDVAGVVNRILEIETGVFDRNSLAEMAINKIRTEYDSNINIESYLSVWR